MVQGSQQLKFERYLFNAFETDWWTNFDFMSSADSQAN